MSKRDHHQQKRNTRKWVALARTQMRDAGYRAVQRYYQNGKAIVRWHGRPFAPWWRLPPDRKNVVFAGVIAAATVTYAVYAGLLWNTTRREFELSERPWVKAEVTIASALMQARFADTATLGRNDEWIPSPNNWDMVFFPEITLNFRLENVGRSPAIRTWILAEFFPSISEHFVVTKLGGSFTEHSDIIERQAAVCEKAKLGPDVGNGFTLFPATGISKDEILTLRWTEMLAALAKWQAKGWKGARMAPEIVGCVDYQFPFAPEHHQTPFMFRLVYASPEGREELVPAWEEIPQSQLRLKESPETGRDAD